jgi:hypothetical protein
MKKEGNLGSCDQTISFLLSFHNFPFFLHIYLMRYAGNSFAKKIYLLVQSRSSIQVFQTLLDTLYYFVRYKKIAKN